MFKEKPAFQSTEKQKTQKQRNKKIKQICKIMTSNLFFSTVYFCI